MKKKLSLSCSGLLHAFTPRDNIDFTFYVGENKYSCNHIQACFISPVIHRMMIEDPLLDSYRIPISDNDKKFKAIIKLMNGNPISIKESTLTYILEISKLLGNSELINTVSNYLLVKPDISNVFDIIKQKRKFNCSINEEMNLIAEHFCEFQFEQLKSLTPAEIRNILNMNDKLKLKSEDSLYEIINQLIFYSEDYTELIECVSLENLSYNNLVDFISSISLNSFTPKLWDNICMRMKRDISQLENCEHFLNQRYQKFPFNPRDPMKGIFSYLTEKYNGNIHKNKIVVVTASSEGGNKPFQVVNHKWCHYFFTKDEPNAWLCFDFGAQKVSLTDYTIKSAPYGPGACHMKNWVIEGSDDGKKWEVIDKRVNEMSLNAASVMKSFHVHRFPEYRFIRLRIIGEDHHGKHYLQLAMIELFGELFPPESKIFQSAGTITY
ncbi:F5/8 type C domain containing protein [Tritrichomonas foetus]|uniref:F5/8 type C domain containing protein n=1 Tax=Tritrichomonas foetus TaxID=1144522 RepID=A0A1J4KK69_9EUKA|nr:F5/8 type C domain containing protein [Tritrichomonas foetus]|eukprot:OHT10070.1 F5/8 type C domain containing protein [Tritrichomonas foetus]